MTTRSASTLAIILGLTTLSLACGGSTPDATSAPATTPPPAASSAVTPPPPATPAAAPATGGHEHAAPHGGILVELGDEFAHLELMHDRAAGSLLVYVLDGEAEKPVRLTARTLAVKIGPAGQPPSTLDLAGEANVLTGETVGDTSQFRGMHDVLKQPGAMEGTFTTISVRGQTLTGVAFTLPPAR